MDCTHEDLEGQRGRVAEGLAALEDDQLLADPDRIAAERWINEGGRDQAASDRDLVESGGSPHSHEVSRDLRRRTARERERTGLGRVDGADRRDESADARDVAGLARDQAADARDLAMDQRDAAHEQNDGARAVSGAEIVMRAGGQRKRAAQQRMQGAEQRGLAAQDRRDAGQDREQAAQERRRSLMDREMFARQLAIAEIDPLTGARTLAAGLSDLDRELDRCRQTSGQLVVAYVDVIGVQTLSDGEGQGAADALLKGIVALIRKHLRSFDLIIRLGGDELLCAMSNVTLPDARERFSQVAAALAADPDAAAITAGFAELAPDDSTTELIARADSELIDSRRANH